MTENQFERIMGQLDIIQHLLARPEREKVLVKLDCLTFPLIGNGLPELPFTMYVDPQEVSDVWPNSDGGSWFRLKQDADTEDQGCRHCVLDTAALIELLGTKVANES